MGRLGYYDPELLLQHEAERRRRYRLRKEILHSWRSDAKIIWQENESMLQREARREALIIIEESARTAEDFDRVTILWDCLDIVEKWRLDKQVPKRTELLTEHEFYHSSRIIPPPIRHAWWQQILSGNFIDVIFDCPHEVQELTSGRSAYELVNELSEKQKEILYYWAIRLWTPQRIAAMREQTDRNIRKVYNNMMTDIRNKLFGRLYPRYEKCLPLTSSQVSFVERYIQEHCEGVNRTEEPEDGEPAKEVTCNMDPNHNDHTGQNVEYNEQAVTDE